jgi:carbon-monoxide dehydrogenase medium subunit
MVGAAAVLTVAGGKCTAATVAIGGLTPKATRATAVESAVVGQTLTDELIHQAAAAVAQDLGDDVMGDIHASAEYRQKMAPVFVARAIKHASQRV